MNRRALLLVMMGLSGGLMVGCTSPAQTAPAPAPVVAVSNMPVNKYCPVDPSSPIDPKVTYLYDGKVYGFCCQDCVTEFKKHPEKYAANAK